MNHRAILQGLAAEAVRDPAHASAYARAVLDELERWRASDGEPLEPPGYLYAGARSLIAQVERLPVEPLPEEPIAFGGGPNAVPITTTNNAAIQIKMPVDVFIYGVAGYCRPDVLLNDDNEQEADAAELGGLSAAAECRDFFSVAWDIDGETSFSTDGEGRIMTPAAAVVGTRERPRALAWKLRRDQTIGVRFRNIWNAILPRDVEVFPAAPTITAGIVFYAVNLERVRS